MKEGKFIVFEGLNGCGKGTQIEKFSEYLYNLNKSVTIFRTREPNAFDENGKKAREILSSKKDPYQIGLEAAKYFSENRKTHNKIILPLLKKGIHVISDRYWHSNFAFQGAQGVEFEEIAKMNRSLIVPDLTYIFLVSPEEAYKRIEKRDGEKHRIFDNKIYFMKKVDANYKKLQNNLEYLLEEKNIVYINGMQPIDKVFEDIKNHYEKFF